jgi:ribosomal protein L40E
MIKVCINCNTQNLEEAIFCKKCGTKLPTLKEIENSLREEQEESDRKWKEDIEKTKQQNDALSKERRNEGSVVTYDTPQTTVSKRTTRVSRAKSTPHLASSKRRPKKRKESINYIKILIILLAVLLIILSLSIGYKYLSDNNITMNIVVDNIKKKIGGEPKNTINSGRELGIFIDSDTGLIWQDDDDAGLIIKDWKEAEYYCNNLLLAGKSDWRLPLKTELESISDTSNTPAIKDGFFNASPTHYWASPIKVGSTFAWHIYFGAGGGSYYEAMRNLNSVRCVREE